MRLSLRLLSSLFVLALLMVACGGDDDASSDPADGAPGVSDEPDSDEQPADDGDSADVGVRVTIGPETFEATREISCITLGGALNAQFVDDDETVTIYVALPPTDWESDADESWDPPSVRVDDERDAADGAQWVAGSAELEYADNGGPFSSVESFDVDGKSASGDATFIDNFVLTTGETPETLVGSFEVTCES